MAKSIQITVNLDGTTEIETSGFTGKACKKASQPFEEALGTVTSDTLTAEGREEPKVKPTQQQQKLKGS